MRLEHLKYLACPNCASQLRVVEHSGDGKVEIERGALGCPDCGAVFPVVRHVPRFVPVNNYARSFGFEWSKHARTQYDAYSGAPISQKRFFEETKWPRRMEGDIILEVGSGSGRFTQQAASTGAMVISMDYSCAVDANFASNGDEENVLIVQADVYSMPFPKRLFDKLFCFGVLQCTPDPERAFLVLPEYLKPGGELVIDIYRRRPWLLQLLKPRYWFRPFTRGTDPEKLYRWCQRHVNRLWAGAKLVNKLPFGRGINAVVLLVPDYRGVYPLSEEMLREWATLDMFDMLSPMYEKPQTLQRVKEWFCRAGLEKVKVQHGYLGIVGTGRKKAGPGAG